MKLHTIIALATITYIANGFINGKEKFLAKNILAIFFTLSFWHIRMDGFYMMYLYFSCIYILATHLYIYHFSKENIVY